MSPAEFSERMVPSIQWFEDKCATYIATVLEVAKEKADRCCESEIEKLFLGAWMFRRVISHFGSWGSSFHRVIEPGCPVEFPEFKDHFEKFDILAPQAKVGPFRADFVIWRAVRASPKHPIEYSPKVIVECDGHDFHDRTKEQAARDKERDRLLQIDGYFVLRFTGSELWKDANECALQVDTFLTEHLSRATAAVETAAVESSPGVVA